MAEPGLGAIRQAMSGIVPSQGFPGMVAPGNIDRYNRPIIFNPDGSISTERSFSVNIGGHEVLLPLIINGREVTPEEAIQYHMQTGEHLGMFDTPEAADAYANQTHDELAQYYQQRLRRGKPGEE